MTCLVCTLTTNYAFSLGKILDLLDLNQEGLHYWESVTWSDHFLSNSVLPIFDLSKRITTQVFDAVGNKSPKGKPIILFMIWAKRSPQLWTNKLTAHLVPTFSSFFPFLLLALLFFGSLQSQSRFPNRNSPIFLPIRLVLRFSSYCEFYRRSSLDSGDFVGFGSYFG